MPRGTFIPFEDPVRFFARPRAFTIECPFCGRMLFIGKGERDAKCFSRVSSIVHCINVLHPSRDRADVKRLGGCGRRFLVGMVAWPIQPGAGIGTRPWDQDPEPHELAQLRAFAYGRFPRMKKKRGEKLNQIEPDIDVTDKETFK